MVLFKPRSTQNINKKIIKNIINFTTEETHVVFKGKLGRKMANNKKSGQVPLSVSPGEPSPTLPARRNFY